MSAVPFVIGQWVSGAHFYGRAETMERLWARAGRPGWAASSWLVGLRRAGKTSLLKQLEHLAAAGPAPVLPLFWDLQGVDGASDLGLSLGDALLETEEMLAGLGVRREAIAGEDAAACLARLVAALALRGAGLLLLVDEAEELVELERGAPGTVRRLWRALGGAAGSRVVLASSPRLEERAASDPAAAWLADFAGPIYLGALAPEEACGLIRQDQLPAGARPGFDPPTVEALRRSGGDHPMLLQMLGRRCLELGDAERAIGQLEADRTVDHLFAVDCELLASSERELLRSLARGAPVAGNDARASRLRALGLVAGEGKSPLVLPNRLLAAWLRR